MDKRIIVTGQDLKNHEFRHEKSSSTVSTLEIKDCPNLEVIIVSNDTLLESLKINNCPNIKRIHVSNCRSLVKIEWDWLVEKSIEEFVVKNSPVDLLFSCDGEFLQLEKFVACDISRFSGLNFLKVNKKLKVLDLWKTEVHADDQGNFFVPESLQEFYFGESKEVAEQYKKNIINSARDWSKKGKKEERYNAFLNSLANITCLGRKPQELEKLLPLLEKASEIYQKRKAHIDEKIEKRGKITEDLLKNREEIVDFIISSTGGFMRKANIDSFNDRMVCFMATWGGEKETQLFQELLREKEKHEYGWKKWTKKSQEMSNKSLRFIYSGIAKLTWEIKYNEKKLSLYREELEKLLQIKELNEKKLLETAQRINMENMKQTCTITVNREVILPPISN